MSIVESMSIAKTNQGEARLWVDNILAYMLTTNPLSAVDPLTTDILHVLGKLSVPTYMLFTFSFMTAKMVQ